MTDKQQKTVDTLLLIYSRTTQTKPDYTLHSGLFSRLIMEVKNHDTVIKHVIFSDGSIMDTFLKYADQSNAAYVVVKFFNPE